MWCCWPRATTPPPVPCWATAGSCAGLSWLSQVFALKSLVRSRKRKVQTRISDLDLRSHCFVLSSDSNSWRIKCSALPPTATVQWRMSNSVTESNTQHIFWSCQICKANLTTLECDPFLCKVSNNLLTIKQSVCNCLLLVNFQSN